MGGWRRPGRLRWAGLGGTWRGDATVGRVLPLFERDLRAAKVGSRGFLSFYLAALLQRSAFDRLGSGGALAVRGFFLAGSGTGLGGTNVKPECAGAGPTASCLGSDARDSAGDRSRLVHSVSPLPPNHRHLQTFNSALGRRDGNDRVDHLRRPDSLQCAPGLRFSSRRVFPFARLLSWSGRRDADRRLRLLGLLQRLFPRRRNQESGEKYSAGVVAIHSVGGVSICSAKHHHYLSVGVEITRALVVNEMPVA